MKIILLLFSVLLFSNGLNAQTQSNTDTTSLSEEVRIKDSLRTVRKLSAPFPFKKETNLWPKPNKAALYSLIFPGLGQYYNKSYWKLPVIYGVLGTFGYFIIQNNNNYIIYRDAYRIRFDNDSTTIDQFDGKYQDSALKGLRDSFRQQRDLFILFGVIAYGLNILEAYVNAHLKHFDISEDLSLRLLSPQFDYNGSFNVQGGLAIQF